MILKNFLLALLLHCSFFVFGQTDTLKLNTPADSLPRIRKSAMSLSFGGPMSFAFQYDYRIIIPQKKWLAADIHLALGGSEFGTGFYWGGSALFFPKRFKLEAGGGLAFAQTGEWGYWLAGARYESKKWFMTGLNYTGLIGQDPELPGGRLQFLLGWRF